MSTLNVNNINEVGGVDAVITAGVLDSGSLPAGSVLQVVRATDGTVRTTTSTSYTDAGISVSITPVSASSNLIVMWNFVGGTFDSGGTTNVGLGAQITDSSNNSLSGAEDTRLLLHLNSGEPRSINASQTLIGYVAAGSTAARTYKGRFRVYNNPDDAQIGNNLSTGQMVVWEVAA